MTRSELGIFALILMGNAYLAGWASHSAYARFFLTPSVAREPRDLHSVRAANTGETR